MIYDSVREQFSKRTNTIFYDLYEQKTTSIFREKTSIVEEIASENEIYFKWLSFPSAMIALLLRSVLKEIKIVPCENILAMDQNSVSLQLPNSEHDSILRDLSAALIHALIVKNGGN